jgi:hypothetical protein
MGFVFQQYNPLVASGFDFAFMCLSKNGKLHCGRRIKAIDPIRHSADLSIAVGFGVVTLIHLAPIEQLSAAKSVPCYDAWSEYHCRAG